MVKSTSNQLIIDELSTKIAELIKASTAEHVSTENILIDTAPVESAVSSIQAQIQSINYQQLEPVEIEQMQSIQDSLNSLLQNFEHYRDTTKNAIRIEQNKSKLKKVYG